MDPIDVGYLQRCLDLADRGARSAAPNPLVGCVVVRDGIVIGEGWHERPGLPHAEAMALAAAGDIGGATVYVSLEPCAHQGRTPPCADLLVAAGAARVVVGSRDPDPRTDGRGIERLRAAGVQVELADGEIARRARLQNAGFRALVLLGRPHVTYKAAVSLDGRTATASGQSRWISSPESRARVHEWRARASAVAVGAGTALADDPMLTARDCSPPAERQPLRLVFDRRARLPLGSALVRSARQLPLSVVVSPGTDATGLASAGAEVIEAESLAGALAELGRRELSTLLVEGGAGLAGALLEQGLVDRLALFVAPMLLGGGPGVFAGWSAAGLDDAVAAASLTCQPVGADTLLTAELREI
jgi:diaminohydroxyphosphoribosylaminopyrimidine deaminase/5-amino-6-(5-phosphoribosylamino)uracil reductase